MKRIFFALVALVALSSCGGNQMYFDNVPSRNYDDPNAEFDTLSYAVGMNVGLGLSLQNADMELITDIVTATVAEELAKSEVDYDAIDANSRLMTRFSMERSRPYQMAKRMHSFIQTDRPDTLTLPEIYDEEFTRERVSKMFGVDVANYIKRMDMPVNLHWLIKAVNDATLVSKPKEIDSIMSIKGDAVRKAMSEYVSNDWSIYNLERTREWLKDVAAKSDVHMMVVENDTLYYRVDVAGNGLRTKSDIDTIGFTYEVYTRSGRPVESTAKRVADMRYNLEQVRTKTIFADSAAREKQIAQIEAQIEKTENLRIPVKNALIKGAQHALQNVSEGGEITIWMPSSLAYGERGNRAVGPNDGIVMRVKLNSVTIVEPSEDGAELKPGEASVKVIPTMRPKMLKEAGKPVVIPATNK